MRSRVDTWTGGDAVTHEDSVIAEEPLEMRLDSPATPTRRIAVTMRTPGADFELAAGFVVGEGIARPHGHITSVGYCTDRTLRSDHAYNVVTVTLNSAPQRDPAVRNLAQTSACGVCGKDSLEAVEEFGGRPVTSTATVPASTLGRLPGLLRERQRLFDSTGGVHAAGLFGLGGDTLLVREDVGRHNAMDKVVGRALLDGLLPLHDRILCVSGRQSFELVQKTAVAGAPILVGVGAPTSLAVELAADRGLTLCGFARRGRLNVYTGAERVGL